MFQKLKYLNVFQYCKFLKLLGHVMVLMVLSLVGVSYYVVVPLSYGPMIVSGSVVLAILGVLVVLGYSLLIFMLVWSYFACVTTDAGRVPSGWHPFSDEQQARIELERMAYSDYYFDRRDPRRPRYCKRCQAWKPERSHHCSVSGHCVLKMDHYCIWVVNCVGLLNYKFFLLFLFYTFMACLVSILVLIKPLISFFTDKLHGASAPFIFVAVVMDAAFCASIAGFLIMHGQLLVANCTTIEMYEKDRIHPWPYNKGIKRNFEEVLGRSKLRWFVPYYTKEERRALMEACLNPRSLLASAQFMNPV